MIQDLPNEKKYFEIIKQKKKYSKSSPKKLEEKFNNIIIVNEKERSLTQNMENIDNKILKMRKIRKELNNLKRSVLSLYIFPPILLYMLNSLIRYA